MPPLASVVFPADASSRYSGLSHRERRQSRCKSLLRAQRRGGLAAFVDAEHALDPAYAKKLGVDVDNLLLSQPTPASRRLKSLMRW